MKRRSVVYAPEADATSTGLRGHSLASSPSTAFEYVQRVRAFCEKLAYASERGRRRDDIRDGLRVIGFERRVTVAFSVDESRATILRLFYGGQDWEKALR